MDTGTNTVSGGPALREGAADTRGPVQAGAAPQTYPRFTSGQFIKVKADHPFRAGQDGMVCEDTDDEYAALIFRYDRHNQNQDVACVGREMWRKDELDLTTLT